MRNRRHDAWISITLKTNTMKTDANIHRKCYPA